MKNVIVTRRCLLEKEILLKDGRKAIVKGYEFSMSSAGYEITEFNTNIGRISASEVKEI